MDKTLDVYLHEKFIGKFTQHKHGQYTFQYNEAYANDSKSPQLSVSLPLQTDEFPDKFVRPFFAGILPEANLRVRIARCLGISEQNIFSFLQAMGGECAGAVSLYPEGQTPFTEDKQNVEILDDQRLLEVLETIKKQPLLAGIDNIRISLAGAQDKLPVTVINRQIALIHGATPTTHILKPLIAGLEDTVHNEFFLMRLAAELGINAPKVELGQVADKPYFLVERYDRIKSGNKIKRLHQEDFCQALGIIPEQKYENEGGPSVAKCLQLINEVTASPINDRRKFLRILIFNYLIGNADAHGKNFSLLYNDKLPELAPAYDLISTEVYPQILMKMAMKIGGKYDPYFVFPRHWHRIVADTAIARNELDRQLLSMSKECVEQAHALKNKLNSEGITAPIFADIIKVIEKRSSHIQKELLSKLPE